MTVREWFTEKGFPMLGFLVLMPVTPEMLSSLTSEVPLGGEAGDGLFPSNEEDPYDLEHQSYVLQGSKVIYVRDRQECTHPRWGSIWVSPGWYIANCFPPDFLESEANVKGG